MRSILFCLLVSTLSIQAQEPLITTTGKSKQYVVPDEILIRLEIESIENKLSDARSCNAAKARQVIDFLKSKSIAQRHIQTQVEQVGPVYKRRTHEIENFRAQQSISVCIKKLEDYDNIIDGLLGLEVLRIQGPNFRTTEIVQYKEKARIADILAAREKAITLANALGQSIGKAHLITEKLFSASTHANAYADNGMNGGMGAESSLSLGQIQVQATIEVSFELLK